MSQKLRVDLKDRKINYLNKSKKKYVIADCLFKRTYMFLINFLNNYTFTDGLQKAYAAGFKMYRHNDT